MPTLGTILTTIERDEQVEKHGFSTEKDAKYYEHSELVWAALATIFQDPELVFKNMLNPDLLWPADWGKEYLEKIKAKDRIGQLKVAAALLCAEIDRLADGKDYPEIDHNQLMGLEYIQRLSQIPNLPEHALGIQSASHKWIGEFVVKLNEDLEYRLRGPIDHDDPIFVLIAGYRGQYLFSEIVHFDQVVEKIKVGLSKPDEA